MLVTRARSNSVSSNKVRLSVCRMQPSTWARTVSGLIISPQSWAHTMRVTRIAPVARSSETSAPMAMKFSFCL